MKIKIIKKRKINSIILEYLKFKGLIEKKKHKSKETYDAFDSVNIENKTIKNNKIISK